MIEEDGHIGHGAVLHGCHIGRNVLVGMNAVMMDGAEIGESSILAAMAFVRAKTAIPPRSLAAGIPRAGHPRVDRRRDRLESARARPPTRRSPSAA